MATTTSVRYADDYPQWAPTLPGQTLPWLIRLRSAALETFKTQGFPSPREEEWRYTNVSALEKKQFSPVFGRQVGTSISQTDIEPWQLNEAWTVAIVDGCFTPEWSNLDGLPDTVKVISMAEALLSHPDWVEKYFGQAVLLQEHGFTAFNTAWFADGAMIHVPAGLVLERPIQVLTFVTQPDVMAVTRNLIVIDDQAEAELIETFTGSDIAYLTNSVTEIFVEPNAGLTLTKLQCDADKAYHFGGTYTKVARDARFKHHNFAFGSILARSDVHVDLARGSDCALNGLYFGWNRQHLDNHTRINHLEPQASSRELYKGVLGDRARGVFQGRVIVAENAQHTDSAMNNSNLLLSDAAEADTKPQLEIYADDVKCSHGVTVGQLDDKSVFYLQSRGVDEDTARNMLTFAFANEMVDKIRLKGLHDRVLEQVLARFPQEGVKKSWL